MSIKYGSSFFEDTLTPEPPPRIHECYICGKRERWNENWAYYGSIRDIDDGFPVLKVCSKTCRDKLDSLGPDGVLATEQEGLRRPLYG